MPLPLTISCSSKSRLVLTFLVLPFWYLLTQVDPDIFQTSSKTVVCCVCVLRVCQLLVKIDQEMWLWECAQTDIYTDTQMQTCFIISPMLYGIAMGQIMIQFDTKYLKCTQKLRMLSLIYCSEAEIEKDDEKEYENINRYSSEETVWRFSQVRWPSHHQSASSTKEKQLPNVLQTDSSCHIPFSSGLASNCINTHLMTF